MLIPQAADILDLSESQVRELCRRKLVKSERKRGTITFLLSRKSGGVTKVTRTAYQWVIDGKDLRRLKRERNRG